MTKIFVLIALGCSLFLRISAQPLGSNTCEHISSSNSLPPGVTGYSYNGECHTPKGNLHILIVFIGFTDPNQPPSDTWPYNEIPEWATGPDNDIFNEQVSNIGSQTNVSSFYKQMSLNEFTITATVYPNQAMVPYNAFLPTMNAAVCNWLSNDNANYNWGQFDNRTNNANWVTDNQNSMPDGKIDYAVFVYRNLTTYAYSGISGIGGSNLNLITNYGGTPTTFTISNGHASAKSSDNEHAFWGFFEHEFGHNFYDCPHYGNTNGTVGNRFYTGLTWGMMSGDFRIAHCANAWEKWYLGWIDISADGIAADIDDITDLDAAGNDGIYTLRACKQITFTF